MNYTLINIISYFQETIKVHQVRLINIVLVSLLIGFAACNEKVTGYVIINDFQINKAETIVSGGGCFNNHVINMIKKESNSKIVIPDIKTINYKEAMIFGFIGLLKFRNEVNCYNSVTGAKENSIVGVINKYL